MIETATYMHLVRGFITILLSIGGIVWVMNRSYHNQKP